MDARTIIEENASLIACSREHLVQKLLPYCKGTRESLSDCSQIQLARMVLENIYGKHPVKKALGIAD